MLTITMATIALLFLQPGGKSYSVINYERETRRGLSHQKKEHIRGHLWHVFSVEVNKETWWQSLIFRNDDWTLSLEMMTWTLLLEMMTWTLSLQMMTWTLSLEMMTWTLSLESLGSIFESDSFRCYIVRDTVLYFSMFVT